MLKIVLNTKGQQLFTLYVYEARSSKAKNITAAEVISFKRSLDDSSLFSVLPEIDFVMDKYQKEVYCLTIWPENITTKETAIRKPKFWGKEAEGM